MWSSNLIFVVIEYLVLLVNVPVVEDTEDVLSRAVDGAAQQEVGETEVEVLLVQLVVSILKENLVLVTT